MLNLNRHRVILLDLLRKIYTNRSLSSRLGFKGGTALLLFYGLDRFSVDLDFDLLEEGYDEEIFQALMNYAKQFGEIKESVNGPQSIKIIISYEEGLTQNIKIEVSKRKFGSKYEIKNLLGLSMKVMTVEDIFANKLVALTDRKNRTNRDLYDLYFMFEKNWSINQEIIETRIKLKLKDYLPKAIAHVQATDRKHILSGLGELLDEEKKKWVKAKLVDELLYKLEQFELLSKN